MDPRAVQQHRPLPAGQDPHRRSVVGGTGCLPCRLPEDDPRGSCALPAPPSLSFSFMTLPVGGVKAPLLPSAPSLCGLARRLGLGGKSPRHHGPCRR